MTAQFTLTSPVRLMEIGSETEMDLAAPSPRVKGADEVLPSALMPAVPTVSWQISTVKDFCARGPVVKVDWFSVKVHAPPMVPEAVPSDALMENVGAAAVPENFNEVDDAVPKTGIPALKTKLLSSTLPINAACVLAVMVNGVSFKATSVGEAGDVSVGLPH